MNHFNQVVEICILFNSNITVSANKVNQEILAFISLPSRSLIHLLKRFFFNPLLPEFFLS